MKILQITLAFFFAFNLLFATTLYSQEAIPKIRLGHDDQAGFHRQLLLGFDPLSTNGVDNGFDAKMLDVFSTDAYWYLDNQPFVIQTIPFDPNALVDIGVVSAFNQVHTFMIDTLENYTGEVFLYDNLTGQLHNLKQQAVTVNIGTGTFNDRFKLTFSSETLSLKDTPNFNTEIKAFYNPKSGYIQIDNPQRLKLRKMSLFGLSGQLVLEKTNLTLAGNKSTFSLGALSTGLYFLKIESEGEVDIFKIVKF